MLSDKDRDALEDIRDNIARAVCGRPRFASFPVDDRTFYAVTRCLEIISEASRRLSPAFKASCPTIPWKDVAGAGNIHRHNYDGVQERRVWNTVHDALPQLRAIVESALDP